MKQTVLLVVLDGWGMGRDDQSNPIYVVNPQNFALLKETYPMTSLQASGISVGLPWGEVGNSEVGHLTIGAGRVLYQYFPRITIAIRDKSFFENPALKGACAHARKNNSAVNFVGLLSKGNVHASLEHLLALIALAEQEGVPYRLHLMSDGKDSPPKTLESFLDAVPFEKLASLVGRYYGMDREGNWSLTAQAYNTFLGKTGTPTEGKEALTALIHRHYESGANEEFLPPLRFGDGAIRENDAVIFFNYREDSIRQIAEAFIRKDFTEFPVSRFENLYITTMSHYEDGLDVPVAFPPERIVKPLGKVLMGYNKTQLRVAESYKYAHVTYFFNGLVEPPFTNEYRVLIPSLNAPRVESHPEMMASQVTDRVIQALEGQSFDFILVNYANPDTIAHSGNYEATMEAVKVIDREIGRILKALEKNPGTLLITSDHGNAEELINPMTGQAETQHDPSPVPFHIVSPAFKNRKFIGQDDRSESLGTLADVAPTVLSLMGLTPPPEMTGQDLTHHLL